MTASDLPSNRAVGPLSDGAAPLLPDAGALPDGGADAGPAVAALDAGQADASSTADAQVVVQDPFASALIHHYAFDGIGTTATDGAGSADGTLVGATLDGQGAVALSGGLSGPHVTLPAALISGLESLSVEAWLTWNGGLGYQRVFDFGNSNAGAGAQGAGTRHFSLAVNGNSDFFRLVFDVDPSTDSRGWRSVSSSPAISTGQVHQVVAVFDRPANELRLYVDGARRGSSPVPANEQLSGIDDVNNWLGMAQWGGDPNLDGTLHDVRLYDVALSDEDASLRFTRGYD